MPFDPQLEPHFEEAARLNNLDPTFLKAVASGESGGRAGATSEKNAGGLMQILPGTAQHYGINDPYDPVQAIYGGARILNDNLTQAEQLKAQGRDISPVDYALKMYFGGNEGPQWGPKTAAYPGYIGGHYKALMGSAQPQGQQAQLASAGGGDDGSVGSNYTPQELDYYNYNRAHPKAMMTWDQWQSRVPQGKPMDDGVAQLAQVGQPKQAQQPAIPTDEELLSGLRDLAPMFQKQAPQQAQTAPSAAPVSTAQPQGQPAPLGSPGVPQVRYADPNESMFPPSFRQQLMTFPDGQQRLEKIIELEGKGIQLNRDGTQSVIKGGVLDPSVMYQGKLAEALGSGLLGADRQGNISNIGGAVPSAAAKAGATKGAEAEAALPSQITQAQAESWIKAGFDLKPGFDPQSGLPGYVNGRGQFLRLGDTGAAQGQPVVSENPYLKEQAGHRDAADKEVDQARKYRQMADDFVGAYSGIQDPGAGQQKLQDFRKIGQQLFQLSGQPVPQSLADATSATEAAKFVGQELVARAAKDFSARAAQQLVNQLNAVKMSPETTQEGVQKLHKLIYGATQPAFDAQKFTSEYYGSPEGRLKNDAPTQFNTKFPTTAYTLIGSAPFAPSDTIKAIDVLRANPGARDAFDKRFGAGSSGMVLGR